MREKSGFDPGTAPNALPYFPFGKSNEAEPYELVDNRKLQTQPNVITPPVDGEYFEVNRTFKLRRSTIRMLNRLKAEHEDENTYLSSIVDDGIRHYFEGFGAGKLICKI
jgi:hypothetical protein